MYKYFYDVYLPQNQTDTAIVETFKTEWQARQMLEQELKKKYKSFITVLSRMEG